MEASWVGIDAGLPTRGRPNHGSPGRDADQSRSPGQPGRWWVLGVLGAGTRFGPGRAVGDHAILTVGLEAGRAGRISYLKISYARRRTCPVLDACWRFRVMSSGSGIRSSSTAARSAPSMRMMEEPRCE